MNTVAPYNVLYHGNWSKGSPGHHTWTRYGQRSGHIEERLPWKDLYKLPPASRVMDTHVESPQGHAAVHFKDGWTALAFWDRSVDNRGNCMSCFLVKGDHSFDDMVKITREHFPSVWERFPFDVTCVEDRDIPEPDALTMAEKAADYARVIQMLRLIVKDRNAWKQKAEDLAELLPTETN